MNEKHIGRIVASVCCVVGVAISYVLFKDWNVIETSSLIFGFLITGLAFFSGIFLLVCSFRTKGNTEIDSKE